MLRPEDKMAAGGAPEAEVAAAPSRKGSGAARRGAEGGCLVVGHGEPDGEGRAQHPWHQPAVPGGEDHPHPHLRVQVLEGGVLRPDGYGGAGWSWGGRGLGEGLGEEPVLMARPVPSLS